MSQSSVVEQGVALPGMKYSLDKAERILSYAAEGRLFFGRFASLGTDKELQAKVPAAAADITDLKLKRGVVLQEHTVENKADGLEPGAEDKRPANIMTKGMVHVVCEADVVVGDDVYVRHTADGGLDLLGAFAPATGTGLALLADARWHKDSQLVDGRRLAVLELL